MKEEYSAVREWLIQEINKKIDLPGLDEDFEFMLINAFLIGLLGVAVYILS